MRSRSHSLALVFTFFFFLTACKDKDKDRENFVRVGEVDAAMTAAVEKAKATRAEFARAFNERKPGTKGFYVKKPFPTPGAQAGAEHIWLEVQELDGETLKGRVANQPQDTKAVRFGETVSLQLSEISDWKYQDGEKLMGGYTIRYFVDKMSPAEQEAFFKQNGFRF